LSFLFSGVEGLGLGGVITVSLLQEFREIGQRDAFGAAAMIDDGVGGCDGPNGGVGEVLATDGEEGKDVGVVGLGKGGAAEDSGDKNKRGPRMAFHEFNLPDIDDNMAHASSEQMSVLTIDTNSELSFFMEVPDHKKCQ